MISFVDSIPILCILFIAFLKFQNFVDEIPI